MIRGKKDLAKCISKYIIFEFLSLVILFNIHDIVDILLNKLHLPEKLIGNALHFIDLSSGLLGFAVSSVLAVMGLQAVAMYYKNRGEHEVSTELITKNNIAERNEYSRPKEYTEAYERSLIEEDIEDDYIRKRVKMTVNKENSKGLEIDIEGIEEIASLNDIKRHKKLNKT